MVPSKTKPDNGTTTTAPNLWSKVLADAASKKSIKPKNLIIMGDENSGKSSLVAQFLKFSQTPGVGNGLDGKNTNTQSQKIDKFSDLESLQELLEAGKNDFSLSYVSTDILDEDNEEVISRLGIYQIASDLPGDRELLKLALDKNNYLDSAVIINLDWSRPYRFIKSLLRWLNVLADAIENIKCDTAGRQSFILATEEIERYLQLYTDPDNFVPKTPTRQNQSPGVIDNSAESDAMAQLERESMFNEEIFDYIQQTLRSICLQRNFNFSNLIGAALFYTSQASPMTFSELRHYTIHRLLSRNIKKTIFNNETMNNQSFKPNKDDPDTEMQILESDNSNAKVNNSLNLDEDHLAYNYPFRLSAQVLERDTVRVPSGWDTKAKINFLRDGFDVDLCLKSFSIDSDRYKKFVSVMLKSYSQSNKNLRYDLDRIVREAQKNADSHSDYNPSAESTNLLNEKISLLDTFKKAIGATNYHSKSNFNNMGLDGNTNELTSLTSYENEQEFLSRLYADQIERASAEESIDTSTRLNRNPSQQIQNSSGYQASQSRYKDSENSLSTAVIPIVTEESPSDTQEKLFISTENPGYLNQTLGTPNMPYSPNLSASPSVASSSTFSLDKLSNANITKTSSSLNFSKFSSSRNTKVEIEPTKNAMKESEPLEKPKGEKEVAFDSAKLNSFFSTLMKKKPNANTSTTPNNGLNPSPSK
ncbi:Cytoplasmic dynein 1 light intermediate chain 1 [Smittium culicis]|uniref:Cytoplasmic dynein 1 light intermediate chain 1 n=1 Tax=Smittium culicis TaxID=133412 RepID=A0A1R1YH24_9FUNG|nr:Cytoplasmic dynein 1 light intermediate chain 1 [Smittium culicis]